MYHYICLGRGTADELAANVRANSALSLPWLAKGEAGNRAVIVAGGPSAARYISDIQAARADGATIFACNGAARWLREKADVIADAQVVIDPTPETATLVDPLAGVHYIASRVAPETLAAAANPVLWHHGGPELEDYFPAERVARGGYMLIVGGSSCGIAALGVAAALGHRDIDLYGFDSSYSDDGRAHAYPQPMNAGLPTVEVPFAGKKFRTQLGMRQQAFEFPKVVADLETLGYRVRLHGDGLLPWVYRSLRGEGGELTEQDKYRAMWSIDQYRQHSPGEHAVPQFLGVVRPSGVVVDWGCGSGRASLRLAEAGLEPVLVDFADNARDPECLPLPFVQWDLTERNCPVRAEYGFCSDVLEHIPGAEAAIDTMLDCTPNLFLRVDTEEDDFGEMIGHDLHVTLKPHEEWRAILSRRAEIVWEQQDGRISSFYVRRLNVQ
jgi:hypothetical protein